VGSLDKIEEIVQVRGFVNGAPDFGQQPEVINGASELLEKIFGEKGKHARCALGTSSLPRDITVELEMIVRVRD
ncbi:MAG: RidA family protein, partial [Candidatus Aerophobetes bacterium]